MKKHRTTHTAEADEEGNVWAICETCGWRAPVHVAGLSYMETLTAIFKARDEHEANPEEKKK